MNGHQLDAVELEVLERAIRCEFAAGEWADVAAIIAVVEAILLARRLSQEHRAQPADTPMPRLRTVPPPPRVVNLHAKP